MKKISAILCTLLAIAPYVPQKVSASAGNAIVCLAIGGGLGVLGLGVIHPKTSDYWDVYKNFGGLTDTEKATTPYAIADKYFAWRLPLSATKRFWLEENIKGRLNAGTKAFEDSQKAMFTGSSLAAAEIACILIGISFILKAARV